MKTIRLSFTTSIVLLLIGFNSCKGQNKQEEKFKPDVKISVNKDFDKDNNMIRYDSSYSYSYSSTGNFPPDSLFSKFKWPEIRKFGGNTLGFKDPFLNDSTINYYNYFNSLFPDDHLFRNDLFYNNFFLRNLRESEERTTDNKKGKKEKQY